MALPEETVVCVTGDGSIQMNIRGTVDGAAVRAAGTGAQPEQPLSGMVKQWQDMIYSGRHSQSYMQSLPDFVRLAEAYGHIGIQINHPEELESKLSEALEHVRNRRLVFVDVTVDGSEHVYPMQIRGAVWMKCG